MLPKNEPTDIGGTVGYVWRKFIKNEQKIKLNFLDLILKTRKIPEDTASALKEILAAYLKREKESVDEIIRKFVEQQQTALDVVIEKWHWSTGY